MNRPVVSDPESFIFKYILSSISAGVAETVTYPLDLTKTRLQIQGEQCTGSTKCSRPKLGMFHMAFSVVRNEGITQLWSGVRPAVYRHFVYSGGRMSIYEFLRDKVLGRRADGTIPLWKGILGSMFAGAAGQFIASPTDLVKVQMQTEGVRRLRNLSSGGGHQTKQPAPYRVFLNIVKLNGVLGLWRGWVPNVQRAALVNLGDLATYDFAKRNLLKHTNLADNYITHSLSSFCCGLVAALMGTPADVVKTRIMNQSITTASTTATVHPTDPTYNSNSSHRQHSLPNSVRSTQSSLPNPPPLQYSSTLHCLTTTIKNEGFFALYKGFFPTWMRMAPWSLTFWVTYEQIRRITGVKSF